MVCVLPYFVTVQPVKVNINKNAVEHHGERLCSPLGLRFTIISPQNIKTTFPSKVANILSSIKTKLESRVQCGHCAKLSKSCKGVYCWASGRCYAKHDGQKTFCLTSQHFCAHVNSSLPGQRVCRAVKGSNNSGVNFEV